ncbi:MAG: glycosyltransferase [Bacteroidota bacterium]
MKSLSIVILQYNNSALTLNLLESISTYESEYDRWEILVVDNNSDEDDKFKEINSRFPFAICKKNSKNLGFAKGVNLEIESINSRYFLLINNDMELNNAAISQALDVIESSSADGITCRVVGIDGTTQNNSSRSLTNWNIFLGALGYIAIWHSLKKRAKKAFKVGYINGGFLLMKTELFKEVGMFNESFFMYGEDIDLMLRLNRKKAVLLHTNRGEVLHLDGASARKKWDSNEKMKVQLGNTLKAHCLNKSWLSFQVLKCILIIKTVGRSTLYFNRSYLHPVSFIFHFKYETAKN